jgi:hypothetical protein
MSYGQGSSCRFADCAFSNALRDGLPGAYDVAVADFDGDGGLDVAASSWRKGNRFDWFEQRDGRRIQHPIEENIGAGGATKDN